LHKQLHKQLHKRPPKPAAALCPWWAEAWAQAGMQAFLAAVSGERLLNRCADVRFVLDELARRQAAGEPGTLSARSFGGIRRPVLCATGSLDGDPLQPMRGTPQAAAPTERHNDGRWRRAGYGALPAGDKAELWLDGADHMSFGGQDVRRFRMLARQRLPAAIPQEPRHRALMANSAARAELAQAPAQLGQQDDWRRA
jgi:hypothetical protein